MKIYNLVAYDLEGEPVIDEFYQTEEKAENRIKEIEKDIGQKIPKEDIKIDEINVK